MLDCCDCTAKEDSDEYFGIFCSICTTSVDITDTKSAIMSSYPHLLRRQYTGNVSLKTTDHCRTASFLPNFSLKTPVAIPKRCVNGQFLLELDNVLSPVECHEAIENAAKYIFENMNDKYRFGQQRKSSRLLALDRSLAKNLWENIKDVVSKEMGLLGISKQPHGFDVTRGEWELHGLNEGIRINTYSGEKKEFFRPHKDAQYCPNGDERSIFTLLVYLNEDFEGGQTCFYFPKNPNQCTKGMTIKEEIEAHGSLKEGYDCVEILPRAGHAVISSQNILHEALPVVKGTKYILKTDVVVKRHSKQFGFAVQEREKDDHAACLNFFREAQQNELQGNFDIASDLYEKALSIRYCYPQCLLEWEKPQSLNPTIENIFSILPSEVWHRVFKYLPGYDAQQLVYAYPELNYVKATLEQRQSNIACHLPNEKYFPKIEYQKGVVTCFEFPDAEYFRENMTGCVRVAAMYSFFLLGQKPQDNVYTVKYNPDTEEVCVVALETLLADVFYGRRCYGSFYNIRQQDPERKDPRKDLEASVDRTYMLMQHGAEFTGVELPDSFCSKSAVYHPGDEGYEESDEDENYYYSDRYQEPDIEESGDEDGDEDPGENKEEDNVHVPFTGKPINGSFPVHSILRYVLIPRPRQGHEYGHRLDDQDELRLRKKILRGKDQPEKVYFDSVNELQSANLVSAARVTKLDRTLSFRRNDLCFCCFGPHDDTIEYVEDHGTTHYFNHLVFDFKNCQLRVTYGDPESFRYVVRNYYHDAIVDEMEHPECTGEPIFCDVCIESVLSSDTSFNHAACQCAHPRFDVHEYFNIKDYPGIDTICIIAKEKSEKMIVWAIFDGVVAL